MQGGDNRDWVKDTPFHAPSRSSRPIPTGASLYEQRPLVPLSHPPSIDTTSQRPCNHNDFTHWSNGERGQYRGTHGGAGRSEPQRLESLGWEGETAKRQPKPATIGTSQAPTAQNWTQQTTQGPQDRRRCGYVPPAFPLSHPPHLPPLLIPFPPNMPILSSGPRARYSLTPNPLPIPPLSSILSHSAVGHPHPASLTPFPNTASVPPDRETSDSSRIATVDPTSDKGQQRFTAKDQGFKRDEVQGRVPLNSNAPSWRPSSQSPQQPTSKTTSQRHAPSIPGELPNWQGVSSAPNQLPLRTQRKQASRLVRTKERILWPQTDDLPLSNQPRASPDPTVSNRSYSKTAGGNKLWSSFNQLRSRREYTSGDGSYSKADTYNIEPSNKDTNTQPGSLEAHGGTADKLPRFTSNSGANSLARKSKRYLNLLPRPAVAQSYLSSAEKEPAISTSPHCLLVVLDLNGTLLYRVSSGTTFQERPFCREFLQYLLNNHKVLVWSSARPHNVSGICDKLLSQTEKARLAGVWSRDDLRLTPSQYSEKVQVYKQLSWVWDSADIQASHPLAHQNEIWGQHNTVLIDDSLDKAAAEPWNLIQVEEYEARECQKTTDVLGQVAMYLECLRWQTDASAFIKRSPFEFADNSEVDWKFLNQQPA